MIETRERPGIYVFDGENRFLSNFYPAKIDLKGYVYPSVEHAYVAAKLGQAGSDSFWKVIVGQPAGKVKRIGRAYPVTQNWDSIKYSVMGCLIERKFGINNPELAQKLIDTGDAYLEEGNHWGDRYWGVSGGLGENNLGKLLMARRDVLRVLHNIDSPGQSF